MEGFGKLDDHFMTSTIRLSRKKNQGIAIAVCGATRSRVTNPWFLAEC
jgi:hypothetical protein